MSQCGFPGKQTLRRFTGEDPQHQGVVRGREGWGLGRGRSDRTAHTKASGDPTGSSGARRAPRQSLESITFLLWQVIGLKLTEEVPEVTLGKAAHPRWGQCLGRDSAECSAQPLRVFHSPRGRCGPCTKASLAVRQNLQASPAKQPVAICRAFTLWWVPRSLLILFITTSTNFWQRQGSYFVNYLSSDVLNIVHSVW